MPRRLRAALDYFQADEPRVSLANTVALIILSNQPFYPLYLYFLLGSAGWIALPSLLTAPLFAAVPLAGRHSQQAGARMLLIAGIGNTALCGFALSAGSGVELFYLPCLALALLLFAGRERWLGCAVAAIAIAAAMVLLRLSGGGGFVTLDPAQLGTLARLNGFSVSCLLAAIAFLSRKLWWPGAMRRG